MPVSDKKVIYVDTTTDPDKGVAIADIMSVVPVTIKRTVNGVEERRRSSDLGVLCGGYVGKSVPDNQGGQAWEVASRIDINMWAKFKPVRYAEKNTVGQIDTTTPDRIGKKLWAYDNDNRYFNSRVRPWWEADDGNYGIYLNDAARPMKYGTNPGTSPTIPQGGSDQGTPSSMEYTLKEVAALVDGKMNGWKYNQPRGGANEPYRDLDFNRYNHKASLPVNILNMQDVTASASSEFSIALDPQEPNFTKPIEERDFITPHDLKWKTNETMEALTLHMGFAIFKGEDPIAWVTDSDVWEGYGIGPSDSRSNGVVSRGQSGDILCVGAAFVDKQEYRVLPIYSTESLQQPTSVKNMSRHPMNAGTRIFTVPYTDFITFTAYQAKTSQRIAWGYPSSHKTNKYLKYISDFYLDSNGSYYIGSQTAFTVNVVVTRLTWETYKSTLPNPSSNGDVRFVRSFNQASLPDETIRKIGSCSDSDNVYLDFGETWHVYIEIDGEVIRSHQIKTMSSDEAPV